MSDYRRIAIYWLPEGDLSCWGESWLGWDMARGVGLPRPVIAGLPAALPELTATATGYGLHATIKPPFRLAEGFDIGAVEGALAAFCRDQAPCVYDGLVLTDLDGFLALTLDGDTGAVDAMAGRAVAALDRFRAPAPPEEVARRRKAGLSAGQDANLLRWGYPYVFDDFRFHVTLTDRLSPRDMETVRSVLEPILAPILPRPQVIAGLALVGQGADGFHLIAHHAFTG